MIIRELFKLLHKKKIANVLSVTMWIIIVIAIVRHIR